MKRTIIEIVVGMAILLMAVWGGAWLLENVRQGYEFAAISTSIIIAIGGFALAGHGFINSGE